MFERVETVYAVAWVVCRNTGTPVAVAVSTRDPSWGC